MGEYVKLYGEVIVAMLSMIAVFTLASSLFVTFLKFVENTLIACLGQERDEISNRKLYIPDNSSINRLLQFGLYYD